MNDKWDRRFLDLAEHISYWSKDPRTKVGAVAVSDEKQILSIGWNGFPRNIEDDAERLGNRDIKNDIMVHAEMNCIYNATHNGISLKGATIYVSGTNGIPVCSECAKGIIQVGIKRIVMPYANQDVHDYWQKSAWRSRTLCREANITVDQIK